MADIGTDKIFVLEPNDFGGGGVVVAAPVPTARTWTRTATATTTPTRSTTARTRARPRHKPPDNDSDGVSDLNDPDDDNDGIPDLNDAFAIDPQNGKATNLPVAISWENDQASPGGIANTGFTGLMTNGTTNYLNQFDKNGMVVGGAAGVFTIAAVPAGDATRLGNSLMYGFQLGVNAPSTKFQVIGRIVEPFSGLTPGGAPADGHLPRRWHPGRLREAHVEGHGHRRSRMCTCCGRRTQLS